MFALANSDDRPWSQERNLRNTVRGILAWLAFSVLVILFCAAARGMAFGFRSFLDFICNAVLLGLAFSSLGSLFGFLFGIPRTLQQDLAPSGGAAGAASGREAYRQGVNTNLEQISDWLTKILVGVGLTQLTQIPQKLRGLADYFKPGLGNDYTITLLIILNFLVFGFLASYLLTRLFLAGAFLVAERGNAPLRAVISGLEDDIGQIDPAAPKEQKRNLYEQLIYNNLYVESPQGFQKAIQYGLRYNESEPQAPSARIWAYLAMAYAQQYDWEDKHDKRPEVMKDARKKALEAVRESLKVEPKMITLLRTNWDRTDKTKEAREENDLEVFYADPEFQKILAEG